MAILMDQIIGQDFSLGATGRGRGNGGRFQPRYGNGGCRHDAYQNDTASNATHLTAVSASSTLTNNVPAVPMGRRWQINACERRVPPLTI
jgi:hypothetical protein